jgi:hypothetical protein
MSGVSTVWSREKRRLKIEFIPKTVRYRLGWGYVALFGAAFVICYLLSMKNGVTYAEFRETVVLYLIFSFIFSGLASMALDEIYFRKYVPLSARQRYYRWQAKDFGKTAVLALAIIGIALLVAFLGLLASESYQ